MIKTHETWKYLLCKFNTYVSIYFSTYGFLFLFGGKWFFNNIFIHSTIIMNYSINYLIIHTGIILLFISLFSLELSYATNREMLRCNAMGNCILWSLSFFWCVYFLNIFSITFKIINLISNLYFLLNTYFILLRLKIEETKFPH